MNPFAFIKRRPVTSLILVAALVGGGAVGLSKMRIITLPPKVEKSIDYINANALEAKGYIAVRLEAYFQSSHEEQPHHEPHKILGTSPQVKDVTITQKYVCQIHSQQHISICALDGGYIEKILVKEGQAVKKGDPMFKVLPVLYQAKLEAELAEAQLAQLEFNNTKNLADDKVVSQNDVALHNAKLSKAKAMAKMAKAELDFTNVKAPFDGIVDRLQEQLGSLIKEGDILTTLSDNSVMWVYFNVPEADYLEYMAIQAQAQDQAKSQGKDQPKDEQLIELELANHNKFRQKGKIGAIEAKFNNETGTVPFRADFPNPGGLLRHGQTGNVLLHRVLHDAIVIPQRATFEILDKKYVYVIDKDDVVHQREIVIQNTMDDIYVISKGVNVTDKIVLEGARQIRDGEKVEYEFSRPEMVLANLKNRAE
jgi:membrane fusion protein (multidrug efflux system)